MQIRRTFYQVFILYTFYFISSVISLVISDITNDNNKAYMYFKGFLSKLNMLIYVTVPRTLKEYMSVS